MRLSLWEHTASMAFYFPVTTDMQVIEDAPHALVFLTVDWSGPELESREAVQATLKAIPHRDFGFFAISEEDGSATCAWLVERGWAKHPRGCGSLLWLEFGKVVHTELLPRNVGRDAVVAKTLALWGRSAC
ncbi:MAG TPA: hypothetical protein VH370_15445 [Humisphaera sp.]|jgi:hypothetical protein|nr:hypothetical protein [Humisphaera sp.]